MVETNDNRELQGAAGEAPVASRNNGKAQLEGLVTYLNGEVLAELKAARLFLDYAIKEGEALVAGQPASSNDFGVYFNAVAESYNRAGTARSLLAELVS